MGPALKVCLVASLLVVGLLVGPFFGVGGGASTVLADDHGDDDDDWDEDEDEDEEDEDEEDEDEEDEDEDEEDEDDRNEQRAEPDRPEVAEERSNRDERPRDEGTLTPTATAVPTDTPPRQTTTLTPTPTPTPTPPPTATPTPSPTATQSPSTPRPTAEPSPEPTATPMPSPTPSSAPSAEGSPAVVDASLPVDWLRVGHSATVRVRVTNPGARSEVTFRVTHADSNVSTHVVTVGAEETVDLDLEVPFEEPNDGVVEVNGVPAGELTVDSGDDEQETAPPTEPADQAGFGVLVALFAGLVGTLWVWRGRDGSE